MRLVEAQRAAFAGNRSNRDLPEKGLNLAILASWAFVAGVLQKNSVRLARHFALANPKRNRDPLNAAVLAKGRHKTDSDNYRGLGNRTDKPERGRFAELFFHQAENGKGITKASVDLAIARFHAKQALLDLKKKEQ